MWGMSGYCNVVHMKNVDSAKYSNVGGIDVVLRKWMDVVIDTMEHCVVGIAVNPKRRCTMGCLDFADSVLPPLLPKTRTGAPLPSFRSGRSSQWE